MIYMRILFTDVSMILKYEQRLFGTSIQIDLEKLLEYIAYKNDTIESLVRFDRLELDGVDTHGRNLLMRMLLRNTSEASASEVVHLCTHATTNKQFRAKTDEMIRQRDSFGHSLLWYTIQYADADSFEALCKYMKSKPVYLIDPTGVSLLSFANSRKMFDVACKCFNINVGMYIAIPVKMLSLPLDAVRKESTRIVPVSIKAENKDEDDICFGADLLFPSMTIRNFDVRPLTENHLIRVYKTDESGETVSSSILRLDSELTLSDLKRLENTKCITAEEIW